MQASSFHDWMETNIEQLKKLYIDYLHSMIEDDELPLIEDWETWLAEEYRVALRDLHLDNENGGK